MREPIVSDLKVSDSVLSPQPLLLSPQSSLLSTHSFADVTAALLRLGHTVRFRASGQSMHPTIRDGETIAVDPVAPSDVKRGDILLCRRTMEVVAHRVVAIIRTEQQGLRNKKRGTRTAMRGRGISNTQSLSLSPHASAISSQHSVLNNPRSSILDPQSSFFSTQSSLLITHHSFVLRGDATLTRETVLPEQILGKVVSVERSGRTIHLSTRKAKFKNNIRLYAFRLARLSGFNKILRTLRRMRSVLRKHREEMVGRVR